MYMVYNRVSQDTAKTGGCPEDCGYCSQSAHHKTGLKASKLIEVERVLAGGAHSERAAAGAVR